MALQTFGGADKGGTGWDIAGKKNLNLLFGKFLDGKGLLGLAAARQVRCILISRHDFDGKLGYLPFADYYHGFYKRM